MKDETQTLLEYIQGALHEKTLRYESPFATCVISYSSIDNDVPYSLELIDGIDPENNHFILLAHDLETLLKIVPLNILCFTLVPRVDTCVLCKQYVDDFMQKCGIGVF